MPPSTRLVTLQDIADHTGYGRSTVSIALRNHPGIPPATRDAIRQAAEKLGYRANPFAAALMTRMRGRRRSQGERIALISRFHHAIGRGSATYYRILYDAVTEEAARHAIGIDPFYDDDTSPLSGRRLSQILTTRGIHGLLLFPGKDAEEDEYPEIEWERFTTVLIGHRTRREVFHQVTADNSYNIDCALHHAQAAGCRRIGFVLPAATNDSTNQLWSSRFFNYQHGIPAGDRVPLLCTPAYAIDTPGFLTWFRQGRPDVILTAMHYLADTLREAGVRVPEDVRLISLTQRNEYPGLAGVNPHTTEVGRAAIDLLVSLMQTNQRGVPEFPRTIAVRGKWTPGASFPEPPVRPPAAEAQV